MSPASPIPFETGQALLPSRRHSLHDTGSVGHIVADAAQARPASKERASTELEVFAGYSFDIAPTHQQRYLSTVVGNALLAVGMFLKAHDMAAMRTPEIQFLDHACDAILNGNRFRLESGYMPMAGFDGLIIDSRLDGHLLFDQDGQPGFMGWGDAIALLQWLLRYWDGSRHFVTGGDAG